MNIKAFIQNKTFQVVASVVVVLGIGTVVLVIKFGVLGEKLKAPNTRGRRKDSSANILGQNPKADLPQEEQHTQGTAQESKMTGNGSFSFLPHRKQVEKTPLDETKYSSQGLFPCEEPASSNQFLL